MGKLNRFLTLLKKNLKQRYVYLILITVIMCFFTYVYKEGDISTNSSDNVIDTSITNEKVSQDIYIKHDNPTEVAIKLGDNKLNEDKRYKISALLDNEVLNSFEFSVNDIRESSNLSIVLPKVNDVGGKRLTLELESLDSEEYGKLNISSYENSYDRMFLDGEEAQNTISSEVSYSRFSSKYLTMIAILYIAMCLLVLFIDTMRIHNTVFCVIIVLGTFSAVLNPFLDTPDEHAHLARTELTSRGILFVDSNVDNYNISASIKNIINNSRRTIENNELVSTEGNFDYIDTYDNYASNNIFISYIPQALGILIAKILGINLISIVWLGRIFNLIAYALMIRLALKIAPDFKIPLAIISVMPMTLFIAASFNPDATTYGLTFLLIAYFLKIYKEENISIKQIAVFSVISILLGLVKLPYCVLGGLIIFIPRKKFENKRSYNMAFVFLAIIAMASLAWAAISVLGGSAAGSAENTFNQFYLDNNINTKDQIMYILQNPKDFIISFSKSIFDNLDSYINQLNIFGWLSYGMNTTLRLLYLSFIMIVICTYPTMTTLSKKTKVGVAIASLGVYVSTNLILYLTWTSVGAKGIDGVQGRYFCSLIAALTLLSNRYCEKEDENRNYKYIFIAITFVMLFLITLINRSY